MSLRQPLISRSTIDVCERQFSERDQVFYKNKGLQPATIHRVHVDKNGRETVDVKLKYQQEGRERTIPNVPLDRLVKRQRTTWKKEGRKSYCQRHCQRCDCMRV